MTRKGPRQIPRVLALGSGITLLGVLRTLSRAGIDVVALSDADAVTRRSRWFRAAPRQLSGVTPQTLEQALDCMPNGTILMPCSDQWVRAVAALPAEVRSRYPASIAPLGALDVLLDKARFATTLERLELPHPMTALMHSVSELDAVPESVIQSSFLKPVHSQQFFARFGVKAFRIAGLAAAKERLAICIEGGFKMMLQEYVPGPPTSHYFIDGFVDRDGVMRALFARRRLRMNPPDFGNSTLMISVPLDDTQDGVQTLRTLFADIRYRGVFSAEFKCDQRDGSFNLIEVNARPWWYVEFAARCGVDVCNLAVRDALGEPIDPISRYAVGRRCVFPYYDFEAARDEFTAGRLSSLNWMRSWLGSYQPVFRWSDPLPAWGEIARLMRERIRHIGKRAGQG